MQVREKTVVVSHLQRFSEVATYILGEEVLPACAPDLLFLLCFSLAFSRGPRGRRARRHRQVVPGSVHQASWLLLC